MRTNSITSPHKIAISNHEVAEVFKDNNTGQNSLHATVSFNKGAVISKFNAGTIQEYATYLTVQTGAQSHITLQPEFLQYINHSCDPNVFFDTDTMKLVSLKAIQAGEEMTFFYPSTEWEMAQPFVCNCGHEQCLQLIRGATHLSIETLARYQLTQFIKQQVKQKLSL